ncbi:MAG: hypothetical protein GX284_07510 [Clostridiales bacterium]|nr:hypothetical protein [Clostridiales bacterium]
MRSLDEAAVKDILQNREKKIDNIHRKMISLYQELERNDEVLETVAYPKTELSGMSGGKGNHKDLGDVLLQYNRQICNRNEEIRKIMWELVEEEDSISRLWACFYALNDPFYSILNALYVENQLYQAVENNFDMSHKTFEKYRQRGIELLLLFYNSDESIAKLMRSYSKEKTDKRQGRGKKEQKHNGYEQISLSSLERKEK